MKRKIFIFVGLTTVLGFTNFLHGMEMGDDHYKAEENPHQEAIDQLRGIEDAINDDEQQAINMFAAFIAQSSFYPHISIDDALKELDLQENNAVRQFIKMHEKAAKAKAYLESIDETTRKLLEQLKEIYKVNPDEAQALIKKNNPKLSEGDCFAYQQGVFPDMPFKDEPSLYSFIMATKKG